MGFFAGYRYSLCIINFAGRISTAAMGGRAVLRFKEPKKTGAHSARTRRRGRNPIVYNIFPFGSWSSWYNPLCIHDNIKDLRSGLVYFFRYFVRNILT
jgi:hypothetical protein